MDDTRSSGRRRSYLEPQPQNANATQQMRSENDDPAAPQPRHGRRLSSSDAAVMTSARAAQGNGPVNDSAPNSTAAASIPSPGSSSAPAPGPKRASFKLSWGDKDSSSTSLQKEKDAESGQGQTQSQGPGAQASRVSPPPLVTNATSGSAIDPLSQHIFMRTDTGHSIPQRLRGRPDSPAPDTLTRPTAESPVPRNSSTPAPDADKNKKKGGSFLSRLSMRGPKRRDEDPDDSESDLSEQPPLSAAHAHLYSSIVGSGGYIPHHKAPPRYIKVKAHNKKLREFNRVFLAQELVGTQPEKDGEPGEKNPVVTLSAAGSGKKTAETGGAIWATEFSKDGKYLAAAGRDKIVRIWAVLSTPEERRAQEGGIPDANGTPAGSVVGTGDRLSAPVFADKPVRELIGHTGEVLDLSWSKNNFLLSTSMDKTVRLWHMSRADCLCTFRHKEFVSKVAFHPTDDRFFLAGCLDTMLRLWSIPDKSIAWSVQLPDLITAVAFTPDGKTAIAGLLNGLCHFFETDGLKYTSQIHVRSSRGKNAKGSKITGIQPLWVPDRGAKRGASAPSVASTSTLQDGEVKLLITSTDSRIRIYSLNGTLDAKFKGHEHACSQLGASVSDDGRYIICGSEDRKTFIWSNTTTSNTNTVIPENNKDKKPCESFDAHSDIVTTAVFAPTAARRVLSGSGDPIYDLCNPPPVTLVSMQESVASASAAPSVSEDQSHADLTQPPPTPRKPEESPAYIARSAHREGNIIVTTDDMGVIRVWRQDCAFVKRRHESWETGSAFSKRLSAGPGSMVGVGVGRSASILTRTSASSAAHSRRGSLSTAPMGAAGAAKSDQILSWRQGIEGNGNGNGAPINAKDSPLLNTHRSGTPTPRSERSVSPSKTSRHTLSSSAINLASEARKQPYAASSPLASHFNRSGPPSPRVAQPSGLGLLRKEKTKDKDVAGKSKDKDKDEENETGPPTPSFSFRPASEDDDQLRLDPAGASYSFWNLNKWRGIAGLRASIGGSSTATAPVTSHTRSTSDAAGEGVADKEKERETNKLRRKSAGSPLKPETSASTAADEEADVPTGLLAPPSRVDRHASIVSTLSDELPSDGGVSEGEEMRCSKCGGREFKTRRVKGAQALVCGRCGKAWE